MKPLLSLGLGSLLWVATASAQQSAGAGAGAASSASPAVSGSAVAAAPSISTPPVLRPVPGKPGLRLDAEAKPRKSKRKVAYDYDGVFVRASRMDRPKDLISPKAPAEMGNGEAHLSRNPHTGRAEGIRLFGIRY
ncbi:MAG: hypothetical protein JNN07_19565 [Verrucomicrobiales bacterium]|nr:hypothetical protein [Verrucomicrobiales bacterium]